MGEILYNLIITIGYIQMTKVMFLFILHTVGYQQLLVPQMLDIFCDLRLYNHAELFHCLHLQNM